MRDQEWREIIRRTHVIEVVKGDRRTRETANSCFGYSTHEIFNQIIGGGQADFDEPYKNLSPQERAILYAYFNVPGHLTELDHAFPKLFGHHSPPVKPTVIDLGCGPITAGLAFASAVGPECCFRYVGLDRSASMQALGGQLWDEAVKLGGINPFSRPYFVSDLAEFDPGLRRGELTFVVASYLLASTTLDVDRLVASLITCLERIGPGPVALLYTNSPREEPNRQLPQFLSLLRAAGFKGEEDENASILHRSSTRNVRYAFLYRPENLTVFPEKH